MSRPSNTFYVTIRMISGMEPPPAYEEKPEERAGTSTRQSVSITLPPAQPSPPQYNDALNASTTPPVGTGPPVFPIYLDQPHDPREAEMERGMASIWKLMVVIGGTLAILICFAVIAVWISFSMIR
ncbi:hypothetical protein PRIPAC_87067 [Pristionchus pacificus]|uniref:Uncharacterized protein n=1 Tax=Pristionchus pacificus TaxID=54126 RepID=A0A2A6BKQ1_PRIPA|nr:hypothetical protein PRIPAC_87067 [Pristionchus pacificus]|eukprot:PDM66495.1 hypothetical protein PRIPAC_47912 [Pristionchus pacificus]